MRIHVDKARTNGTTPAAEGSQAWPLIMQLVILAKADCVTILRARQRLDATARGCDRWALGRGAAHAPNHLVEMRTTCRRLYPLDVARNTQHDSAGAQQRAGHDAGGQSTRLRRYICCCGTPVWWTPEGRVPGGYFRRGQQQRPPTSRQELSSRTCMQTTSNMMRTTTF